MKSKALNDAKKKALAELIKKMRGMESASEGKEEEPKEDEDEGLEEALTEEDQDESPSIAVEEPDEVEDDERKAFFKDKPKGPRKATRAIIMSVAASKAPVKVAKPGKKGRA
jgi:hypothetical protein